MTTTMTDSQKQAELAKLKGEWNHAMLKWNYALAGEIAAKYDKLDKELRSEQRVAV